MAYSCKRCGYTCAFKSVLVSHLQRKSLCNPVLCDDDPNSIIRELDSSGKPKKYICQVCRKGYTNRQSKYIHQRACKNYHQTDPVQSKLLDELQSKMVELENKLSTKETKDITPIDTNLLLELQYYKNRKNEKFYQMLVEQYLGGTHKSLECGITDVTTNTCHAEVKEWKSWKEAVGQLTCYNAEDPKQDLAMYMFGRYKDSCKEKAVAIAKKCGFKVFAFTEGSDGQVCIKDCFNDKLMYTYTPSE